MNDPQKTVSARIGHYDADRCNAPLNQARALLYEAPVEIEICGSRSVVALESRMITGDTSARKIEVAFNGEAYEVQRASVSLDLDFSDWSADHYVLMPAAACAGNRFAFRRIPYSPKPSFPDDIGPDKLILITDIPKLNERDGSSAIQERSRSMALPCITLRLTISTSRAGRSPDPRGESLGREKTNAGKRALGQDPRSNQSRQVRHP